MGQDRHSKYLFQTCVYPDNIHMTTVMTLLRLYKWLVMLMGCRNALAAHQQRTCIVLHPFIGKICHAYLGDIIIWSSSVAEHLRNVEKLLQALCKHLLFCPILHIVTMFGPHHIGMRNRSRPKKGQSSGKMARLVRYMASFLPNLVEHMAILTLQYQKKQKRLSLSGSQQNSKH